MTAIAGFQPWLGDVATGQEGGWDGGGGGNSGGDGGGDGAERDREEDKIDNIGGDRGGGGAVRLLTARRGRRMGLKLDLGERREGGRGGVGL